MLVRPSRRTRSPLLSNDGWESRLESSSLLRKESDTWRTSKEAGSHLHVLRRLFEDLDIDAVFCVSGYPTVCVKSFSETTSSGVNDKIVELCHRLWNLNATTLLMVEAQESIKIFSTLRKPEHQASITCLSDETITALESSALALSLSDLVRRIETGTIYDARESLFRRDEAVDQVLLHNLKETRNKLVEKCIGKKLPEIHALLGKFLFACYLFDRGIIDIKYLKIKKLPVPNHSSMSSFLNETENKAQALKGLFDALHWDFNGSLFGDTLDAHLITDVEVQFLADFLAFENVKTGQQVLPGWKLYDFSFIPVELISSIYETFIKPESDELMGMISQGKQRVSGAYYTPPRLAELALNIATEDMPCLLGKTVLDPACGSGVFLVILFIRMAEEWNRCNPDAQPQERYNALLGTLKNLCGSDISETACRVACFSLYLAFLDQMEPKTIMELREVLEKKGAQKILPHLFCDGKNNTKSLNYFGTICVSDFFDLSCDKKYDLVVGNPPWVSNKRKLSNTKKIWKWLDSDKNPYKDHVLSEHRVAAFFPNSEFACAFMWKSVLHTKVSGKVCQILPARVFLATQKDKFQADWLSFHALEKVWLLADWRFILFPSAKSPALIVKYRSRDINIKFGKFPFITPKVENIDPRGSLLPVASFDQKELWEEDIVTAAKKGGAVIEWKKFFWGTPRDVRLLERLLKQPRVKTIVSRKGWFFGQGFKYQPDRPPEGPVPWNSPECFFLNARKIPSNLILSRENCELIGTQFDAGNIEAPRNPKTYMPPMVLWTTGSKNWKVVYSDFPVYFRDAVSAVHSAESDRDLLHFLTAYLSSPLAKFVLFHASANWGIERDKVLLDEILNLPFLLPGNMRASEKSVEIIKKCSEIMQGLCSDWVKQENQFRRDDLDSDARKKMNDLVFQYFSITPAERILIEDTVNIIIPSSTPGSLSGKPILTAEPSTKIHREQYAKTIQDTLHRWTSNKNLNIAVRGTVAQREGIVMISVSLGQGDEKYLEQEADAKTSVLLNRVFRAASSVPVSFFQPVRDFMLFEGQTVHILRSIARRGWTRTAALNDLDEIVTSMMIGEC